MTTTAKTLAGATIQLLGACLDAYAQPPATASSLTQQSFSLAPTPITAPPALPRSNFSFEPLTIKTEFAREPSAVERAQQHVDRYREIEQRNQRQQQAQNTSFRAAESKARLQADVGKEFNAQSVTRFRPDLPWYEPEWAYKDGKRAKRVDQGSKGWGRVAPDGTINGGWGS